MPRTIWARADRRIARWNACAAIIRSRYTACACRSAGLNRSTAHTWHASAVSSRAISRRWCPNISPGRRMTPAISTICCPALYRATLCRVCDHIDEVQEALRRPILLENPSTYVAFRDSTMSETDFIRSTAQRTGCGVLLDINNVFVSATNHGFSALQYLADFPLSQVGEIHLAGHAEQSDDEGDLLLIDSHDGPVADAVWRLFEIVIARRGPIPTLIEWDSKIPDWPILKAEAAAAQAILDRCHARGNRHAA
jgi:hypothetical protein